jgi:hypothetical protein
MVGRQHLEGKVLGSIDLGGTGRSLNDMWAEGEVHLHQADIYELPLMMAVLSVLTNREPNRSAFSTADTKFRIKGGHIYLTDIFFNGDVFRLEGRGLMEFDSSIRLTFRAVPGRRGTQPSLVGKLLGGASEQIMVIHVGGTLENPVHRREPFPGLSQALRQIQSEMQRTTGLPPLFLQPKQQFLGGRQRGPNR